MSSKKKSAELPRGLLLKRPRHPLSSSRRPSDGTPDPPRISDQSVPRLRQLIRAVAERSSTGPNSQRQKLARAHLPRSLSAPRARDKPRIPDQPPTPSRLPLTQISNVTSSAQRSAHMSFIARNKSAILYSDDPAAFDPDDCLADRFA